MKKSLYNHIPDALKMKMIGYVCGHETDIVGTERMTERMSYRIKPHKKLMFLITVDKVYASPEEEARLIAYCLTFICFANDHIKETYPEGKELKPSEQDKKIWWEKQYRNLAYDFRKTSNLTPASIIHIGEDESFVGATASAGIDAFYKKMTAGKWFLSFHPDNETATIYKWNDGVVTNSTYQLNPAFRNHEGREKHLQLINEIGWYVKYPSRPRLEWNALKQRIAERIIGLWPKRLAY